MITTEELEKLEELNQERLASIKAQHPENGQLYISTVIDLLNKLPQVKSSLSDLKAADFNLDSLIIPIKTLTTQSYILPDTSIERFFYSDPSKIPNSTPEINLTIILDIDGTLITHASNVIDDYYTVYSRPFVKKFIDILSNIPGLQVIIWTAATKEHARNVLNHIDPECKIKQIIHRQASYPGEPIVKMGPMGPMVPLIPNWDKDRRSDYNNKKILDFLPKSYKNKVLIIDDSIEAISHSDHVNPAIKVSSFAFSKQDRELVNILFYVLNNINYDTTDTISRDNLNLLDTIPHESTGIDYHTALKLHDDNSILILKILELFVHDKSVELYPRPIIYPSTDCEPDDSDVSDVSISPNKPLPFSVNVSRPKIQITPKPIIFTPVASAPALEKNQPPSYYSLR